MRRIASTCALVACGFAGIFSALVLAVPPAAADDTGGGETSTVTQPPPEETTPTQATEPAETTPQPPPPKPKPKGPKTFAAGLTIGGTLVGGLTAKEARALLRKRFARPVPLVVSPTRRIKVLPRDVGAVAAVEKALRSGLAVRREGFRLPLSVDVPPARLARYVGKLADRLARDPVDARLRLRGSKPVAIASRPGRRLNEVLTRRAIRRQLKTHAREPYQLPLRDVRPVVTEAEFDHVIVIRRDSRKLFYYEEEGDHLKLRRVFRVATGQSAYPTPLGRYEVVVKQRNPWWYPPQSSAWAKGKEPVPPGPGNPLGTRWMGISAPYVGIHGTPDAASIGYSASHGCVRMLIPEVEWLFDRVTVGTPVFIIPA